MNAILRLAAACLALVAPAWAASGDLDWVRTSLSTGNGQAEKQAMWVDGNDNLFGVGVFKGTTLTATSETVLRVLPQSYR